jgi:hypothetical protein
MFTRVGFLRLKAVLATLLLAIGGQALAASAVVTANVNRVLISADARWGGCMAALSVNPQTVLAGCSPWWVTFSCSGDFTDPVRAYRMLDQTQLALATGKMVSVWFQDDKKHNGYCFADRIDIVR